MKNIGRDKNHTWYSRTSNRIDWKSVAPNSKLRQDLNKNNWTACFHMETNSTKIQCIENEEERFLCVFFLFLFLNHSSTRANVPIIAFGTRGSLEVNSHAVTDRRVLDFIMTIWIPCMNTEGLQRALLWESSPKNTRHNFKNRTCITVGVFYITLIRSVCVVH